MRQKAQMPYCISPQASVTPAQSKILHSDPRPRDVRDSLACIQAAKDALGFTPSVDLRDGLVEYWRWLRDDPLTLTRQ